MLSRYSRPMTTHEQKLLGFRIKREARVKSRIVSFLRILLLGITAAVPTGLVVAYFKTTQLGWFTCGLMIFTSGVMMALFYGDVRECNVKIAALRATADANVMDVVRCQATEMVEFEEYDDEGPTYVFQVEADRIWVVSGQDFYPTRKFPSTDFEIITSRGPTPFPAILRLAGHGTRLSAIRVVSVQTQRDLRIPEHGELITGRLADLEGLLERPAEQGARIAR